MDPNASLELNATNCLGIQLLAFNVGYQFQDIQKAVYIGLGGTILTFVLVVPPWPFYKTNPVKWLPAGAGWQ